MKRLLYILLIVLAVGCGPRPSKGSEATKSYAPGTRRMERSTLDSYWDKFDFEAGERVSEYDTLDLIYAMADYVTMIEPMQADSLLRGLMHRAEASRPVLDMFATITELVLHDPNSPLRNDEYYIPILEVLVASPLLDEYDRIAPAYDLELALKNRLGSVATDFAYTLADGRSQYLHALSADYTILMFSNPECPMCRDIRAEMASSPLINELRELGRLNIVIIYPDEDIDTWRAHLGDIPEGWINGYDKGQRLTHERLYNLNAIPALYLLDGEKRVMVKDGTDVAYIENIIALSEAER